MDTRDGARPSSPWPGSISRPTRSTTRSRQNISRRGWATEIGTPKAACCEALLDLGRHIRLVPPPCPPSCQAFGMLADVNI